MSIYRTLLEEDEINVIDNKDNDGYEEVKDLMDVIDDGEVNIQEVEDAADAEFGPDDVDDIMDEFCLVIAESEMAWNTVLEGIGVRELNEAVRGINEEKIDMESIKSFFGGMKEKVAALYTKIMGVLKKYSEAAVSAIKFNITFTQKHREDIINGAKAGVSIQGYPYSGMSGAGKFFKAQPFLKTKAFKIASSDAVDSVIYNGNDKVADIQTIIGALTGGKVNASKKEYKSEMIAYLRGNDHKVAIKASGKDLIAVLEDKKGMLKAIQDVNDSAKSEYKSMIKALHKLEKVYEKRGKKIGNEKSKNYDLRGATAAGEGKANAAYLANSMKDLLNVSTIAKGAILKMVKEQAHQARKLANACVKASKKGSKGIEESFEYGYLSDLNLI